MDISAAPPAQALTIASSADANAKPSYTRPEYVAATPARVLCRALMAGTQGVRALGQVGLPKWPAEKPAHYRIRAAIVQVARYYARTVQASVGMIMASPPTLDAASSALITADCEDIDGRGTHLEVFARHVLDEAINGGFCAILVDAPPAPPGLTLADELALGLRPFWVAIAAERILSWIVEVPDWMRLIADYQTGALTADQVRAYAKQTVTRQVVLFEPADVGAGTYGVTTAKRYRVLRLTDDGVTFAVWEYRTATGAGGEHFALVASGPMVGAKRLPFREIPLAIVYAGRKTAEFVAEPPLLALAELNLDHYQVSADRRYMMRLCHAPTLFLAGFDAPTDGSGQQVEIEVGPNSVLRSSDPNAKAAYVSADPKALDSSEQERNELVRQMATLGMSFLGKDRRGQMETATGRALDDAAENATHATTARGLQDGLEQALRFHALYRGVDAPSVLVNTTYASPEVDPQIAAVLWQAVLHDKLDVTAFLTYVTTGALPADYDAAAYALDLMAEAEATGAAPGQEADAQTIPGNSPVAPMAKAA